MLRPGTYLDRDDNLVQVSTTADGGYLIRHADGSTTAIGGSAC